MNNGLHQVLGVNIPKFPVTLAHHPALPKIKKDAQEFLDRMVHSVFEAQYYKLQKKRRSGRIECLSKRQANRPSRAEDFGSVLWQGVADRYDSVEAIVVLIPGYSYNASMRKTIDFSISNLKPRSHNLQKRSPPNIPIDLPYIA